MLKNFNNLYKIKKFRIFITEINFGPQHPAAHGVLRLILTICGELILKAEPHVGLLHRGTEKLIEHKSFVQALPYFDRLDYVSMMCNEHCFSLVTEQLLDISLPVRTRYIRVLFVELTRVLNHIMAVTTHAMDVGALTPFLWCFEEREKIMEFYERVSGARMHACFIRPGAVAFDLTINLLNDIFIFATNFKSRILEIEELLNSNRIWKQRLSSVGKVAWENALNFGFSGVMLRGSGLSIDIRKNQPYEIYNDLNFKIPVSLNGDCLSRYFVRIKEMKESINIILQIIEKIPLGKIKTNFDRMVRSRHSFKNDMESLINHFKNCTVGKYFIPQYINIYTRTEAPKGEFGVNLTMNVVKNIQRCRIRAPGIFHLFGINFMTHKHLIADAVAVIGTQDIVFGEIDR